MSSYIQIQQVYIFIMYTLIVHTQKKIYLVQVFNLFNDEI